MLPITVFACTCALIRFFIYTHLRQCQLIDQDNELSKTYGVCRRSVLCNSQYFHVVDSLPGDAMHDILEGVLQYVCKEMLKEFIFKDKYLTIEEIQKNSNSEHHFYCFNESTFRLKKKTSTEPRH